MRFLVRALTFLVVIAVLAAGVGWFLAGRQEGPAINLTSPEQFIGQAGTLDFTVTSPNGELASVVATLEQNGEAIPVYSREGSETPATPQGVQLKPFVEPFHLPREQLDALLDGVAMDATPRRYASFAELEPYCHRVASSVGLMCAEIFGYRDPAVLTYARDLGVALQLTNILRDVAVDYRRGRMYLPIADLERFACAEADVKREVDEAGRGVRSAKVRAVLEHQASRARIYFARAVRALPKEDSRRFVAAEIMRGIYWDLLRRIEEAECDVFSRLIRVPRPKQALIALRAYFRN